MHSRQVRTTLLATTIIAGVALSTQAQAAAQPATADAVATQVAQNTSTDQSTIVVTGTRIRSPNATSLIPITSVSGDSLIANGNTNIGDQLNDLPQLRSTYAQQNPGSGVGIAGLNLVDLRGLGTLRTLVVVNGRRHVGADILNNAVSPDINSISNDLIDRVDIVTGANSAVYGSDAIAGVVNFVLKRNYQGFQVRGQAGVNGENYGANYFGSVLWGKNFNGGRGNITLQGEYTHQSRIFASDSKNYRQVNAFSVVDIDAGSAPNGSDGVPDRIFLRDVRIANSNINGLAAITQPAANPACGLGVGSGAGGTGGTPYNCNYIFTPDGRLTPQTGTRFGQGITGGFIGGNGITGREGQLFSMLPYSKRYTLNLLSHYEFTKALDVFVEAKWNHVDAVGGNAGPSFINGSFSQFDFRERLRLDNPYLNPADRTTLANAILASGCNSSLQTACSTVVSGTNPASGPLTPTQIANITNGSYRFALGRQLIDLGNRDEVFKRDTYRIVGGLRGTFNDDWNYEISANYGRFDEDTVTNGYLDRQRFMLSLDAGRNLVTGAIQCRSQFAPSPTDAFSSPALTAAQNAAIAARLASDIAACVPYNPFGQTGNAAAINYFQYHAHNTARMTQLDFNGFVAGDLSQLFELPGGPIRFVLGGEYRRETAKYINDPYIVSGSTNAVIVGLFNPPAFKVTEGYGELNIPLLKDTPFFQDLTLNGAGRVSRYGGGIGTVWTYNAGGEWAPIRDLRFRAGYGKAVRAPNLSETGFPIVPNFAPNFSDPCRGGSIGSNAARAANCATDLGALLPNLAALSTYSLPVLTGSNPNLKPESSYSLTLGGVLQPRFIPNFTLSVDYYHIKVNNVIVSLDAQTIANNCYDQPSLANPFCATFTRYRGTGTGPFGEAPGQILGNTLIQAGVNFAKRVRSGIDVNAAYRVNISNDVKLAMNLVYVHTIKSSNYENPALPNFENRVLGELGDPQDEFRLDTDLTFGNFTFGHRLHYIGKMFTGAYEDFNALPGACTPAGCPPNNLDFADVVRLPSVIYNDIRGEVNFKNGPFGGAVQLYAGVDNVFNRLPPYGITGTANLNTDRAVRDGNTSGAIYDPFGRKYYVGFRARF